MEVAWITGERGIGQRTLVCGRIDKGVKQDVRNKDEIVNCISSPNGWTNREDELRTGAVSPVLYRTQTERLARVVSGGRVCHKQ